MEANITEPKQDSRNLQRMNRKKLSLRSLRLSLKYRPEILKLVLKMRQCLKKKNLLLKKFKQQLKDVKCTMKENLSKRSSKEMEVSMEHSKTLEMKNSSTQTSVPATESQQKETKSPIKKVGETTDSKTDTSGWDLKPDEEGKSIADQVKEAAQSALQQSGMVYVESAGMYYDYKTGYYYSSELGLYYHTDTNCYYYYNEEKKEFAFHSYPDRSAVAINPSLDAHEKRKARKQRKGDGPTKAKKRKKEKKLRKVKESTKQKSEKSEVRSKKSEVKIEKSEVFEKSEAVEKSEVIEKSEVKIERTEVETEKIKVEKEESNVETQTDKDEKLLKEEERVVKLETEELEDGECSETGSEDKESSAKESSAEESSDEESNASTASLGNDDSVAKHHPPCMRIIVRETTLPKLKVGTLFLVTKDGGTVGREGEQHTILLRDQNVSRNHLEIRYDMDKRTYTATDLGSKNGSFLNGVQMADSQVVSLPMEVMHGSIIQLGETKLLCHIHPGNDTCGHCEPGLIMETQEKEKVAYTRTCDVKKQYELELARLKNKYKPEPLMIEDGSYNDRAKARRETVGSSHHSEKTQSTDTETHIEPDNKGFKLLQKMGWSKGEGLGKDNQGDTAPIPLVSNEGKVGLGAPGSAAPPPLVPLPKARNTLGPATLRLATRSKLLQAPAKAFQEPDEEEEEE